MAEELKRSGSVEFEDGWFQLRSGLADVVAFLMERIGEAKDEARFEDGRRFEELKAKEEWQTRYEILRQALVEALGPNAATLPLPPNEGGGK